MKTTPSLKRQREIRRAVKCIDSQPWSNILDAAELLRRTSLHAEADNLYSAFSIVAITLNRIDKKMVTGKGSQRELSN